MKIKFTSPREKRLWIAAITVQLTLFASLWFSGLLLDILFDEKVYETIFFFGFIGLLLAILIQGLRIGKSIVEFGVLIAIIGAFMIIFARLGVAERSHLFEYSAIALLVFEALRERSKQGVKVTNPALLAILFTTCSGIIDEVVQLFVPARVFDPIDILFNTFVAVMTVMSSMVLLWVRKQFSKK